MKIVIDIPAHAVAAYKRAHPENSDLIPEQRITTWVDPLTKRGESSPDLSRVPEAQGLGLAKFYAEVYQPAIEIMPPLNPPATGAAIRSLYHLEIATHGSPRADRLAYYRSRATELDNAGDSAAGDFLAYLNLTYL